MFKKATILGWTMTIVLIGGGCATKKTCPAYQSYFLLDEESQLAFFSPFEENDSDESFSSATNIDDMGMNGERGEVDTSFNFNNSKYSVKDDYPPTTTAKRNQFGISDGPSIKSYKKWHYVVPMQDTYVEKDSTSTQENVSDTLTDDTSISDVFPADTLSN